MNDIAAIFSQTAQDTKRKKAAQEEQRILQRDEWGRSVDAAIAAAQPLLDVLRELSEVEKDDNSLGVSFLVRDRKHLKEGDKPSFIIAYTNRYLYYVKDGYYFGHGGRAMKVFTHPDFEDEKRGYKEAAIAKVIRIWPTANSFEMDIFDIAGSNGHYLSRRVNNQTPLNCLSHIAKWLAVVSDGREDYIPILQRAGEALKPVSKAEKVSLPDGTAARSVLSRLGRLLGLRTPRNAAD